MIDVLGWLNLVLIILMIFIFPMKRVYLKKRNPELLKIYRSARTYHPILGFVIVIIGLFHGYLALGTIKLHTGTLVLFTIIFMGCIPILGRRKLFLNSSWLKVHRLFVPLLFILIFIHIYYRNLLSI